MKENIFNVVEGLTGENLTTAVLKYLLENEINQKIFINMVKAKINDIIEYDQNSIVTAQSGIAQIGRFDLKIDTKNYILIIENKFFASSSKGDQIKRYIGYLKKECPSYKKRILLVITIKDRLFFYKNSILEEFRYSSWNDLKIKLKDEGIEIDLLAWDDLLDLFSENVEIINEIREFIKIRYISQTILNKEELSMINTEHIPDILEKYWNSVGKLRDNWDFEQFNTGRMSQSQRYFGFYVKKKNNEIWIGYSHEMWKIYGKPFIIQINVQESNKYGEEYKKLGYKFIKGMGYILLFSSNTEDPYSDLSKQTKRAIEKLSPIYSA